MHMDNLFQKILKMVEGSERTAAIAQWLQAFYPENDIPILVGGGAVELYTGGAYTTGDLDFVGHVPAPTRAALTQAGFVKLGKNWIHEDAKIFLEFPSSSLGEDKRKAVLTVGRFRIQIVGPEDLLVDRLAAWKHWESPLDGVNSYLLYRAQGDSMDEDHLGKRVMAEDVQDALEAVRILYQKFQGELPPDEVLEKWAIIYS
jgi:hypothetical protein